MTRILSFDVGYRNLAYSLISVGEDNQTLYIHKYGLKDFGKVSSVCLLVPKLIQFLREQFNLEEFTQVIIENQVGSKLRSIQFVIQTYFETQIPNSVKIVAATTKFHGTPPQDTRTYEKRKSASVDIIQRYLFEMHDNNLLYKDWFLGHDKLDDLCDCVLQVFGYLSKKKVIKVENVVLYIRTNT